MMKFLEAVAAHPFAFAELGLLVVLALGAMSCIGHKEG